MGERHVYDTKGFRVYKLKDLHNGRWLTKIERPNGTILRKSHNLSKADALAEEKRILDREIEEWEHPAVAHTVAELFSALTEEKRKDDNLSLDHKEYVEQNLDMLSRLMVDEQGKSISLSSLNHDYIKTIRDKMVKGERPGKSKLRPLSKRTIQGRLSLLREAIRLAIAKGWMTSNPAENVFAPKKPRKNFMSNGNGIAPPGSGNDIRPATLEEVKKILDLTKKTFGWLSGEMVTLVLTIYTGLRIKNVVLAKWERYNTAEGTIGYTEADMKMPQEHIQYVHPVLARYLAELKRTSIYIVDCPYIPTFQPEHEYKEVMYKNYYNRLTRKILKPLGILDVSPHSFRKFFSTYLLDVKSPEGMPLVRERTIDHLLAHSKNKNMLARYAIPTPEECRRSIAYLPDLLYSDGK